MYGKVSLPKKSGGQPVPKDSNVIFIAVGDIKRDAQGKVTGFPTRDAQGVLLTGTFELKENAKAYGVYMTPTTISRGDTPEGDDDAEGFKSTFSGERPGNDLAFAEWVQKNLQEGFIIISRECSDEKGTRVSGTPCNPMKMLPELQDNNEAKKSIMNFEQKMRDGFVTAHYRGTVPALYDDAGDDTGSGSGGGGI